MSAQPDGAARYTANIDAHNERDLALLERVTGVDLRSASAPCSEADETEGGAWDPCSHLANALRIVEHFGDQLLFVEGIGWHVWQPPWRCDELDARRIVQGLGAIIAKEAAELGNWVAAAPDAIQRKEREAAMTRRFKWVSASESAPCIEHSLRMASARLACKAEALDAEPMLLGLPNGVLELDTGRHRDYLHSDRITKTIGCDFSANAAAPTWERFLAEIMGGDEALIEYAQTLAGYALSGQRGEHLLPILWGSGANGKSTFLGALQGALGDYASSAAPGLLIQRGGNDHPTALADLQGKRLIVCSETGESGKLNEEQAKLLTGGDTITARRMRMDFYEFKPTHLLMLQTNHRPRVTGTDEGVWRRLRLIPFTVTIPPEKRDPHLPEKLKAELSGILAWCWRGWQRYQNEGFKTPDAVKAATSEYRDASDAVGTFLAECCGLQSHMTASAGELYRAYTTWCEETGERARSQREFGMRLAERGLEQFKGAGGARRWRGIGIVESGASGGGFGLIANKNSLIRGYTEINATSATPATAEDYRRAKDGEA